MSRRDGPVFRNFAVCFWDDPAVRSMTASETLVYCYLRTCRHLHMAGIGVLPAGYIEADLPQLAAAEVDGAMSSLESRGLIRRDQPRNVVWIADLAASQVTGGHQIKAIERHLAGLHGSPLVDEWRAAYPEFCQKVEGDEQGATQAPTQGAGQGGVPLDLDLDLKTEDSTPSPAGSAGEPRGPDLPDEARRLAQLLADLMRRNDPKARVPADLTSWAVDLDRLHRIDGRDWPEIERVMRWCQSDDFWRGNILSASKLRKQFGQLVLKANPAPRSAAPRAVSGPPSATAVLAALDARRGGDA